MYRTRISFYCRTTLYASNENTYFAVETLRAILYLITTKPTHLRHQRPFKIHMRSLCNTLSPGGQWEATRQLPAPLSLSRGTQYIADTDDVRSNEI